MDTPALQKDINRPSMLSLNTAESEPSNLAQIPNSPELAKFPRHQLIYPDPVPTETDVIKIKKMYGCA